MPEDLETVIEAAIAAHRKDDFRLAAEACDGILAALPDQPDAIYLSGLCHGGLGNPGAGLKAIKRAVALKPEFQHYDILRDRLIQQGEKNQMRLLEARFLQYRLFRRVDAFLISYPKCGRTWLRFMLGIYVLGPDGSGDPLEVLKLTAASPDFATLEISHDDFPHWKPADKVFTDKQAYTGKKVIFLARDPRDVLVSYYFQYTRRNDRELANDAGFKGSLSDFVRHRIGGLASLVAFYNAWAANRHVPAGFQLVTYEEMSADPKKVLLDVVAFLGWPERDPGFIDDIMKLGSFANMRNLEATNAFNNPRLRPPEDGDPESFKVRRGKVGGFIDYLSVDDLKYVDHYLRDNLDGFYTMYRKD